MNRGDDHPKRKSAPDARAGRLAAALKANLRRRKAQARERAGANRTNTTTRDLAEIVPVAGRNEE